MSHVCRLHCRFRGEQNVNRTHKNGNCKWLVEEVRELRRTISNSVAKVAQNLNISEYLSLRLFCISLGNLYMYITHTHVIGQSHKSRNSS
jgi:hypothetical protein